MCAWIFLVILCFDEDKVSKSNALSKKKKVLISKESMVTRHGNQTIFKMILDFDGFILRIRYKLQLSFVYYHSTQNNPASFISNKAYKHVVTSWFFRLSDNYNRLH